MHAQSARKKPSVHPNQQETEKAAREDTGIDIYMGVGGAPEGVLAAAALRCIGGQMQGRLVFRNDEERKRAVKLGVGDLSRKYDLGEMAKGEVIFAATGVTDGSMLHGVRRANASVRTESLVMRSKTGTVRVISAEHNLTLKPVFENNLR